MFESDSLWCIAFWLWILNLHLYLFQLSENRKITPLIILHSFMSNWLCTSSCNPNLGLVFLSLLNILLRSSLIDLWKILLWVWKWMLLILFCFLKVPDLLCRVLNCNNQEHKTWWKQRTDFWTCAWKFNALWPINTTHTLFSVADFFICKLTDTNGGGAWPSRSRTCRSLPHLMECLCPRKLDFMFDFDLVFDLVIFCCCKDLKK